MSIPWISLLTGFKIQVNTVWYLKTVVKIARSKSISEENSQTCRRMERNDGNHESLKFTFVPFGIIVPKIIILLYLKLIKIVPNEISWLMSFRFWFYKYEPVLYSLKPIVKHFINRFRKLRDKNNRFILPFERPNVIRLS